jgi:extracellular factor (EF) 3-hydroxypalmitic acid methyl ester biosynthesis protein
MQSVFVMSKALNSNTNGNGLGASNLVRQIEKKAARAKVAASPKAVKESLVTFQTAEGLELSGVPVRITRHSVVFELYNPGTIPRLSETLTAFEIILRARTVYSGHALVSKVLDAGTKVVCQVSLDTTDWLSIDLLLDLKNEDNRLTNEFRRFLKEWQKLYMVSPEFKTAVSDMHLFLSDLRLWMEEIDLKIQAQPVSAQGKLERIILETLNGSVFPVLASLFEKFEKLISKTEKESEESYILYARRLLHPLVLCAPFMRRTFEKPLGYAGDYEMVNMMARDSFQGDSLFAKILNAFFLNTPPVVAHRNRLDSLVKQLHLETQRATRKGQAAKIFNLGCGPALEIQRFLINSPFHVNAEFTLLDFDDETVKYTQRTLEQISRKHNSDCMIRVIKKSVAQLLKENSKFKPGSYDLVYCAGLFDYLPDPVCKKLTELFYELVAPAGLVLVSNVHVNNPSRGWMEYMVDWHLIYRDATQMDGILPSNVPKEHIRIFIEPTGVNIFAEIRKS